MAQVLTHNQTFSSPQEALLHYGVKGMKWGVRKDDRVGNGGGGSSAPTPTRREVRRDDKVASLTARANKADAAARELRAQLDATPKKITTAYARSALKKSAEQNEEYRDFLNKNAERVRNGKMTTTQRNLLIGGVLAGGAVLAVYGSSKMQTGELNAMKLRGQAALRGKPFDFNKNPAYGRIKDPDNVLKHVVPGINPNYAKPGGQMNCRRCTFAYELRRRGYDVSATASSLGAGQTESGLINALSPGQKNRSRMASMSSMVVSGKGIRGKVEGDTRKNTADTYSVKDAKDRTSLVNLFKQQPDGARGEVVFNFTGFGHSLAYERFGDKTYIFDTQKGKRYDLDSPAEFKSFVDKWSFAGGLHDAQVTRLDNLDLDHKFLARWATNQKG